MIGAWHHIVAPNFKAADRFGAAVLTFLRANMAENGPPKSGDALTEAVKGLGNFGPDGLVFAVDIICTFGALIAGAPPIPTVTTGCGFVLVWLLRNYANAHIAVRNKLADIQIESQSRGGRIVERFNPSSLPPPSPRISAPTQGVEGS